MDLTLRGFLSFALPPFGPWIALFFFLSLSRNYAGTQLPGSQRSSRIEESFVAFYSKRFIVQFGPHRRYL